MNVCIILLNYGRPADTLACLDSLKTLQETDFRVVVVDNASPDDSVARFQQRLKEHPNEFHLIASGTNLGYSGGCNLGIRYALDVPPNRRIDYIWLLNNDATVESDSLAALVKEARRTGGLAGSLLLYPDGRYQQVGTRINLWTGRSRGYPESALQDGMPLDTLSGASMLIPMKALERMGLLDESFFLYFEDGEFSLRCRRAGFPLTLAMRSRVYHTEGATTGRKSDATQYYYHRNRLYLVFRFAAPAQKLTAAFYTVFRLLRSVLKSVTTRDIKQRQSLRIQWLALNDFRKGIKGRCPHHLSHTTP